MPIKKAFTLIEILITFAILAILTLASLYSLKEQRLRAEDIKTKTYLSNLKISFEEYYNDHNCFPPTDWFDEASDCGSSALSPYLPVIQCDQKTGRPYVYETDNTTCHQWFKLYATFALPDRDEGAVALRTNDPSGSTKGNYGISSSNTQVSILYSSVAESPTPKPTTMPVSPIPKPSPLPPGHDYYWCSAENNCTSNFDPGQVCSPVFLDDPNCGGTNDSKCPAEDVGTCTPL